MIVYFYLLHVHNMKNLEWKPKIEGIKNKKIKDPQLKKELSFVWELIHNNEHLDEEREKYKKEEAKAVVRKKKRAQAQKKMTVKQVVSENGSQTKMSFTKNEITCFAKSLDSYFFAKALVKEYKASI